MNKRINIGDCPESGCWTIIWTQRGGIHTPPEGTKTCKTRISENSQSYSIRTDLFKLEMLIGRMTKEGQALSALLVAADWDGVDTFFDKLTMKYATPALVRASFAENYREAYDEGYEDRASEIRTALGLSRGY